MKTKHFIYFLMILTGAALMAGGEQLMRKEYAFSLGIALLMFGVYKTSQGWAGPVAGKNNEVDPKE